MRPAFLGCAQCFSVALANMALTVSKLPLTKLIESPSTHIVSENKAIFNSMPSIFAPVKSAFKKV